MRAYDLLKETAFCFSTTVVEKDSMPRINLPSAACARIAGPRVGIGWTGSPTRMLGAYVLASERGGEAVYAVYAVCFVGPGIFITECSEFDERILLSAQGFVWGADPSRVACFS